MSIIPPQYNPKEAEDRIYRLWEESGFFNPDNLHGRQGKTFVIAVPPPNVTGSLHLGHALNAVIQDILIRKKRMEGHQTLWLPGTDHAGIATQNVVEKELKKEGKTRHELGRAALIERIWQWKEKYGNIILDQFKKLGSSMDWSRTRFTMDDEYRGAVEEAFLRYHEKGWIYRAERVINWCSRCQTSLSDLELEYKDSDATLYYIRYPLSSGGGHITVATVRPETMLGDAAVAVHPEDERYIKYVGQNVILPIQEREIPVIADEAVEMEFGTGAVKVTPSHDLLDAEIAERHNLPRYTVIDAFGRMTAEAGSICSGLRAVECREKVVERLKKLEFLEKEEPYSHNIAVCYRCGTAIEPIPSLQWFLKMDELAKLAAEAATSKKVAFHPERWEKVYVDWLKNVKDWTISRQIWWGHRLPVFFCRKKQEEIQNQKYKIQNSDYVVSRTKPETCPFCQNCETEQSGDVLDTWFSSALWPLAVLGWPAACEQHQNSKNKNNNFCVPLSGTDFEKFYPTHVLSTARDIINLWVARMVFSAMFFTGEPPFSDVIIHATILTKDGKRMSKSLGTGVDPMMLVEKHGADALRFGLIWQAMGTQDVHWSEEHVVAGRKFANKVWNIARFVLGKTSGELPHTAPTGLKVPENIAFLERLNVTVQSTDENIGAFRFGQALHALHEFIWHEFADKYIEYSKARNDEETHQVLGHALSTILKLLHPFMPFLTEEIWFRLPMQDKTLIMIEKWPR